MPENAGGVVAGTISPAMRPAILTAANDTIENPLHGRSRRDTDRGASGTKVLRFPAALLGPGEHYALEVSGDSMVEEGILDGDFALIRKVDVAREGGLWWH